MAKTREADLLSQLAKALKVVTGKEEEPSLIPDEPLKIIPTGFPGLDYDVMKIGGLPGGRIIEISGNETSGKSALAMRIMAMCQRMFPDKLVGLVDSEATFMRDWVEQNGVDVSLLQYHKTNHQEEAFRRIQTWVETGLFSVVVLDSLGNLMPNKMADTKTWYELSKDGTVDSSYVMGVFAKLTTDFCKKICMPASNTETLVVIVNQIRADIGGFSRPGMPPPTTTPGGKAFGHDMTNKIVLSKIEDVVDEAKEIVGFKTSARMKKTKVGVGGGKTNDNSHLVFYNEDGIAKTAVYGTYDLALRKGIISVAGAWVYWHWKGEKVNQWNGQKKAIAHFLENSEDLDLLKKHVEESKNDGTFSSEPETLPVEVMED